MKYQKQLPSSDELRNEFPLAEKLQAKRSVFLNEIMGVLSGAIAKKLLLVGPCSSESEDSVLVYMDRLAVLSERIKDKFVVIPRVYTSKPRTSGIGYKGLLHRPHADEDRDDLFAGIVAMRKLHLHVIEHTGMFPVDEMLYPDVLDYTSDLLAYVAVGARSVENQEHRLLASGLDVPVGMKNPTSGDVSVLLNAIRCAQSPQTLIHNGWAVSTDGNPYAHAIVRGFSDNLGRMHPNFHFEDLCDLHDAYIKCNLLNTSIVVDCNHANSRKRYAEQPRIAKEVIGLCAQHESIDNVVKGVMIESYLEDGCQMIGEGTFGKSITDPCLGWQKTERLLLELCDL